MWCVGAGVTICEGHAPRRVHVRVTLYNVHGRLGPQVYDRGEVGVHLRDVNCVRSRRKKQVVVTMGFIHLELRRSISIERAGAANSLQTGVWYATPW